MKTLAIVQARMCSTRLPKKAMLLIGKKPMIEVLLSRLSQSTELDQIVLATSIGPQNQPLVDHVKALGYSIYQGSEDDVLDRYYQAAMENQPNIIVRITGDCPLTDPELVDSIIKTYKSKDADYVSNINPPTYPDGLDVEVFSFYALKTAWEEATTFSAREHVTTYIQSSGKFKTENFIIYCF